MTPHEIRITVLRERVDALASELQGARDRLARAEREAIASLQTVRPAPALALPPDPPSDSVLADRLDRGILSMLLQGIR